jgi:DNA modification methylase
MVFTDPPYGMGLNTDWSGAKSNLKFYKEKGCQETGNKYEQGLVDEFTPEIISNLFACFNYVKEIFLFGADYFAELLPNKNDGSWIVWDKRSNDGTNEEYINQSDKMFGSCFELCWSKNKHRREIARVKWAGIFGTEKEFDKKRCHPTQKRSAVVKWFLDRYSKDNELIVDLFGGSGSTLIACEQLNRKCYTMELDEHYCDVIIQRWENLTGKKAEINQ